MSKAVVRIERTSVEDALAQIPKDFKGVAVICYSTLELWDDRDAAKAFFTEAAYYCEGCERERYVNVLFDLAMGKSICHDGTSQTVVYIEERHAADWL